MPKRKKYNINLVRLHNLHDAFIWMIRSAANPRCSGYVLEILTKWWETAFENQNYPDNQEVRKWVLAIRFGLLLKGYRSIGVIPSDDFMESYYLARVCNIEEFEEHPLLAKDEYYNYIAVQAINLN